MPLEDFYIGDADFHRLALTAAAEWARFPFQEQLLEAVGGDLDLAMALSGQLGENALGWLDQPVPALEDLTPRQCLQTDWGRRRLKECVARMPC